jgi:hypothetical protein
LGNNPIIITHVITLLRDLNKGHTYKGPRKGKLLALVFNKKHWQAQRKLKAKERNKIELVLET